jgi:hypothetical protein
LCPAYPEFLTIGFVRVWLHRLQKNPELQITTPALGAPPLLNQEGSFKNSPPQMRRGGAPSAGVVLSRG